MNRCWFNILAAVIVFLLLPACARPTTGDSPTPTPTATATQVQSPPGVLQITTEQQAVSAAGRELRKSRTQPLSEPRLVSAERLPYADAIEQMQASEQSSNHPPDQLVWLVTFTGDFTFSTPGGVEETFSGVVFVLLLPDGAMITWQATGYPGP